MKKIPTVLRPVTFPSTPSAASTLSKRVRISKLQQCSGAFVIERFVDTGVSDGVLFPRHVGEGDAPEIERQVPDFQKEFLKAFFNDEGSVYFNSSSRVRRVTGVQYDHRILHLVKTLLGNFGISSDIDMHTHAVVISGQSNLLRFRKHIGFARGLTVNGTRANSRWKKSLEKRHILNRAIAFYKS